MEKEVKLGMNRTGIAMSPIDSKELIADSDALTPVSLGDAKAFLENRERYIREAGPVGSVPPPGTLKGAAAAVMRKLAGMNPEVLLDKMGERLGFERSGVRLYDAIIAKCEANIGKPGLPPMETLRQFREEEFRHFEFVREAMEMLGADPTAQTPCADVAGTEAMGLFQVLADPRTSVTQCLSAILIAELADNDGWQLLIQLTENAGLQDTATKFRLALAEEGRHLVEVRNWIQGAVLSEAERKAAKAA